MNLVFRLAPVIGLCLFVFVLYLTLNFFGGGLYQIGEEIYLFDTYADKGLITSSMGLCLLSPSSVGVELSLHKENSPAVYFSRQFPQVNDCDMTKNVSVGLKWFTPCDLEAGEYNGIMKIVTKKNGILYTEEYAATRSVTVTERDCLIQGSR